MMSLSVFLVGCAAAAQLNAGLRDEEKAANKAQGRCGPDSLTCSDGAAVQRDPLRTCQFAPCSGSSFVELGRGGACTYDPARDTQGVGEAGASCGTVPDDDCKNW